MKEPGNKGKINFRSRHIAGEAGRKKQVMGILFLSILLLSGCAIRNVESSIEENKLQPVYFDLFPIGFILPDGNNENLNTARFSCNIENPSSQAQTVTFEITYDLLSGDHFLFDIEHIFIQQDDNTYSELPGAAVEIPGNTTLSLRIIAVDRDSTIELTTRGDPEVKIVPLNIQDRADEAGGYTTDTRSTDLKDREERLAFLSKYLIMPSKVEDAAYHIVYEDASKNIVPSPSDYEIRAVFMVEDEKDFSLWTKNMKKILPQQVDPGWWEDLKTPEFTGEIPSDAEYYIEPGSQSYVLVCPELHVILKMVSTTSLSLPLDDSGLGEELTGYDQFKALAADQVGYDHSTAPYIRTVLAEETYLADGTKLNLICYQAMFCNSPLYGIPILVISSEGGAYSTVLCDGAYANEWYLADIDGDAQDELLVQHLIGITGGAGAYETDIYRLTEQGITKIFESPGQECDSYFDTLFALHLSEGYVHTVENLSTGFHTSFVREASKETPYFDEKGDLTDEGRENNETDWFSADPYFYLFVPVDVDDDGICEIMTAQYTYLYGRADGLGAAYTILKWNNETEAVYITKAGFWPYEDYKEEDQEYWERWEDYENSWYMIEEPKPGDTMDSRALKKAAIQRIREIDFQVRQFPVDQEQYDSDTDKRYREAFYKAVTNQKPVLTRAYRSLDYEENLYQNILRREFLNSQEFLRQELKEGSRYYYMDYDGDGLPELLIENLGLYGLKYDPEQDQVYLFLATYSCYSNLMGAGQIYWHNPCIASKDMYGYVSEDRNGNRVYADFETVAHWNEAAEDWSLSYYISVDEFINVEVSREIWEELLGLLEEARSETPAPVSFEEFFEGFYVE